MTLSQETARKLRLMKMGEIVDIVESQDAIAENWNMNFHERMDNLVDQLYQIKNNKRIDTLCRQARFKWPKADVQSMLFTRERNLEKTVFLNLDSCIFVESTKNVCLYGPTGCGKSYAACAIGKSACRHCYRVRYVRFPDLMSDYALLESPSARVRYLNKFSKYYVLIIDEWLKDVPDEESISFIFELMERREDKHPTIFCSQYAPAQWVSRMGASVKSESITDKVIYDSVVIKFGNFNMRDYLAKTNPKKWC